MWAMQDCDSDAWTGHGFAGGVTARGLHAGRGHAFRLDTCSPASNEGIPGSVAGKRVGSW